MGDAIIKCHKCGTKNKVSFHGNTKGESVRYYCPTCQMEKIHSILEWLPEETPMPYVVWQDEGHKMRLVRVFQDSEVAFVCEKDIKDAMGNKGWQHFATINKPEGSRTGGDQWIIWNLLMSLTPFFECFEDHERQQAVS